MICVFLSPLIFYDLPFSLRVDQTVLNLTTTEISYATLVWVTWILVAGGIIIAGQQRGGIRQHVWQISREGVWLCFVGFATLGSLLSALHQTMLFPSMYENLAHILSLSPTLAIILGIYLLRSDDIGTGQLFIIILLLVPSGIVTFALPALLGYVNPIAISALGILYSLGVMNISMRTQAGLVVLFIVGIGFALAYKSELRTERYGGAFERDTTLISWHQTITREPQNEKPSISSCLIPSIERSIHTIKTAKHTISTLIDYDTKMTLSSLDQVTPDNLRTMAAKGNSLAMLSLGVAAEQNNVNERDIVVAQDWYHRAAKLGNSSAMLRLGYLDERGMIEMTKLQNAVLWYRQAADKQNSNAMKILSVMYEYGYGVKKDYVKAIEHDLQSMGMHLTEVGLTNRSKGDSEHLKFSMRKIGQLYEKGNVVGKDLSKASQWYQRAAIRGDGAAMRFLAQMYEGGNGLAYNQQRALACYKDAAQKGDAPAMRIIGAMHERGHDVSKDYALAHKWYSRAAALDDAPAIRHLAALYKNGYGVPKDPLRAEALYKRANIIEPIDQQMLTKNIPKEDDLKEYDPNYHKLRWPFSQFQSNLYHKIARIAHRLNSLGNLAYAIRVTPNEVPYSYGETYEPLWYKLIPRLIWKDKPVEKTGLVIGLKYGYSKQTDKPFVWSMPTIFESWMAFGWGGIFLTAIAVGVCLQIGWRFLVGTSEAAGNIIFGTLIVMSTSHLSMSSLNLVIGGLVHNLLVFGLIVSAVIIIFRRKAEEDHA